MLQADPNQIKVRVALSLERLHASMQDLLAEALHHTGVGDRGITQCAGGSGLACWLPAELAGRGWRWGHAWDRLISRHRKAITRDSPRCRLPAPSTQ